MPFGGDCEFEDFDACVAANQEREDPDAYCAALEENTKEACAAAETEEADSDGRVTFSGPIAFEGQMTGDGREMEAGSLRWEVPIPLRWVPTETEAHDGATVVGRIEEIERIDDAVVATGTIDVTFEAGALIAEQIRRGLAGGVSVDLDDVEVEVDEEAQTLTVLDGRIRGVTLVSLPAFADARIVLDGMEGTGNLLDSTDAEQVSEDELGTEVLAASPQDRVLLALDGGDHNPGLRERVRGDGSAECGVCQSPSSSLAAAARADSGGSNSGPSVQGQEVREPRALGNRVIRGEQSQERRGSRASGSMSQGAPVRRGEYEVGSSVEAQRLAGTRRDLSHMCTCEQPRQPGGSRQGVQGKARSQSDALLSSSTPRGAPPTAHFLNPNLTEPTPITITDDGRIFGHCALWSSCHTGFPGACVTPPRSASGYAHYRTGLVITAEGDEIPVGRVTMDTGHAGVRSAAAPAAAHYDSTGFVAADVAAGEDRHGVWIAGSLRPNMTLEKVAALRSAPMSGDWRDIGGRLELIAMLAVSVPGFVVPRKPSALVASGRTVSLRAPVPTEIALARRKIINARAHMMADRIRE